MGMARGAMARGPCLDIPSGDGKWGVGSLGSQDNEGFAGGLAGGTACPTENRNGRLAVLREGAIQFRQKSQSCPLRSTCGHGPEADLAVMFGQRYGGQFVDQAVDANAPGLGQCAQPGALSFVVLYWEGGVPHPPTRLG